MKPPDFDRYIKNGGNQCPWCENPNIEVGKAEMVCADLCEVECSCGFCGKEWIWQYELAGIEHEGEQMRPNGKG